MSDNHRSVIVDPTPENDEGLSELPDADTARRLADARNNPNSGGRAPVRDAGAEDTRPEWIPEKFWDGSVESSSKKMADSYQNLESDRGRLANEVGTLRHLVDEALDLKRTRDLQDNGGTSADDDSQPVTADDLLNDPDSAITRAVQRATKPLTDKLTQTEKEAEQARFQEQHPTFQQDLQDDQFLTFVQSSPYRRKLAQKVFESERQGTPDFEAADELWSGWEEVRAPASEENTPEGSEQVNQGGQSRQQKGDDVSQAALATRGGAESDVDHRPVYSRAALVKKRMEDPEGYYDDTFQAEIQRAYVEGRVR